MKSFKKVLSGVFPVLVAGILAVGSQTADAKMSGNGFGNNGQEELKQSVAKQGGYGIKVYNNLSLSLGEDVFVNNGNFSKMMNSLNLSIGYQDENSDGVADIFQNSKQFSDTFPGLNFVDENNDGICDLFQTRDMYNYMNLNNFIDEDGDGICDNYQNAEYVGGNYYARYNSFNVDLSEDIFQNRTNFMAASGGQFNFVDEDGDDICDIFQNSDYFKTTSPDIEFVDENGDGIFDGFQTADFYKAFGMRNFIDTNKDGIWDNYQN